MTQARLDESFWLSSRATARVAPTIDENAQKMYYCIVGTTLAVAPVLMPCLSRTPTYKISPHPLL